VQAFHEPESRSGGWGKWAQQRRWSKESEGWRGCPPDRASHSSPKLKNTGRKKASATQKVGISWLLPETPRSERKKLSLDRPPSFPAGPGHERPWRASAQEPSRHEKKSLHSSVLYKGLEVYKPFGLTLPPTRSPQPGFPRCGLHLGSREVL
jgi:hypothetical protein